MRTLGIDLASSAEKTAACLVGWENGRATASFPPGGYGDAELIELIENADWIGIDAPFGWPDEFVETVSTWAEKGHWAPVERKRLRFRETDRFVEEKAKLPLSVSSDWIAVAAMRCASILDEIGKRRGRISRRGEDQIVEVYPAAALVLWSDEANDLRFDPQGYKHSQGKKKREILISSLEGASPWLNWDEIAEACVKSDDALDALLSALVARAAALELTALPPAELAEQAEREGWIHLPPPASLDALTAGAE